MNQNLLSEERLAMKILGWMHRKFRQNSNEPNKNFVTGHLSFDDDQQNYCNKTRNHHRSSFASQDTSQNGEYEFVDDSPLSFPGFFHGFLAIGTMGTDSGMADPATPTFSYSVDNIMEKQTQVTEDDLQLINDELEKVLEHDDDSSGRNSHVSMGRISHASTITLGGKHLDDAENPGNGTVVCPLQDYLFGSAIGIPETSTRKIERRTSLGELLQKTKVIEDVGPEWTTTEWRANNKESDKSAIKLVKKILKRTITHTSSRTSTAASDGTVDSTQADKKLSKIMQMFHRKVHPETTMASEKFDNNTEIRHMSNKYEVGDWMDEAEEDITIFPQRPLQENENKRNVNPAQEGLARSHSRGTSEYTWIKTDADYLVLEL